MINLLTFYIYIYGLLLKSYQKIKKFFTIYSQMPINQVFVKIKKIFKGFSLLFANNALFIIK